MPLRPSDSAGSISNVPETKSIPLTVMSVLSVLTIGASFVYGVFFDHSVGHAAAAASAASGDDGGAADAADTTGFTLCAQGDFAVYAVLVQQNNKKTAVVQPGKCATTPLTATTGPEKAQLYGMEDGAAPFLIGEDDFEGDTEHVRITGTVASPDWADD